MIILGLDISSTLLLFLAITVLLYYYLTWNHDFWKKKGVPGPRPLPIFGNFLTLIRKGLRNANEEFIDKHGKVVGLFMGSSPRLLISDLAMLKQVMVKDFSSFANRIPEPLIIKEYPMRHFMTVLMDEQWRHVRNILTPAFSSNKLRKMILQINACADVLVANLLNKAESGEPFEMKEYTGGFTMDAIASVGFGLQIDTQKDPHNPFVKFAKKAFGTVFHMKLLLFTVYPKLYNFLARFLPIYLFPKDTTDFFVHVIKQAVDHRDENKELQDRTDLLQIMMNVQVDAPNLEKNQEKNDRFIFDKRTGSVWSKDGLIEEDIVAQSLIFLTAGYDTTATTMAFLAYNLTVNPECQDKLYEEVKSVLAGKDTVTYDMVQQMPYMDMCIQETLRLYSPAPGVERACGKDITINGVFIPKDTIVIIPIYYLHHNPDLWPEPEKFIPERFTAEAKAERDPFCYMPFGMGPRNCIGMRLALIEIKEAMAKLIHKMKFTRCSRTEVPLKMDKSAGITSAENGIYLTVEAR